MTINIYRYDDASAPTLTGQVGSLTTLLDAILVNGYGSKSAAGWAIAFTATNQRAYRAASGNRIYLSVDDTNPGSFYGANTARVVSYEAMTTAIAGTKGIPTPAMNAAATVSGSGTLVLKSNVADATQRPWIAFVSDTFIHFYCHNAITAAAGFYNQLGGTNVSGFQFGDLVNQQKAGDAYATILVSGNTTTPSNQFQGGTLQGGSAGITTAHWMQRAYHQFNLGIQCSKGAVSRGVGNAGIIGSDNGAPFFPDPITGGMEMSEIWVFEPIGSASSNFAARGRLPGLYSPLHAQTSLTGQFQIGDIIPGAGTYAGTNFMLCSPGNNAVGLMQINGTW